MPAAAVGIGGAVSMGTSLFSALNAGKNAKKIQNEIDNYQRQDLVNPYDRLSVSTLGADLQREDLARSMSTLSNQAAQGGSRAIIGATQNALEQQRQQEAQIAANLDAQQMQVNQLQAQGDGMVQQMQEQRERDDLLGLGNALNTFRQERANAWNQFGSAALATGMGMANAMNGESTNNNNKTGSQSNGFNPFASSNQMNPSSFSLSSPEAQGIFASQPTNTVADQLRGVLPSGVTSFQAPDLTSVANTSGKTGGFMPSLSPYGLTGQNLFYYNNGLSRYRPSTKF